MSIDTKASLLKRIEKITNPDLCKLLQFFVELNWDSLENKPNITVNDDGDIIINDNVTIDADGNVTVVTITTGGATILSENIYAAGIYPAGDILIVAEALFRKGVFVQTPTPVAKKTTAVLTAANLLSGCITSTSAEPVSLTTCSAADLIAELGDRKMFFDFVIDNSAGSNDVTLVLDASIVELTAVPNGGLGNLVVTSGTTGVGVFRIYFKSATTAVITRIG